MIKRTLSAWMIFLATVMTVSACGGGGGGGGGTPIHQPTTAAIKLFTAGTATTLYGIDATLNLPTGVTVKSTTPPAPDSGVVTSALASGTTGTSALLTAVYTAAANGQPGTVRVLIVSANGFSVGEFATVNADIAAGSSPLATGFTLGNVSATDAGGNAITGITSALTVDIQ